MDLKFALLCDAANVSREGKLNILGEFNTIWAGGFPTRWPRMVLAARFEAHRAEGPVHELKISLTDQDGQAAIPESPGFPINFADAGPGLPLRAQIMMNFDGLPLRKAGDYEFHLRMDGHHKGSVRLFVKPAKQRPKA